MKTGAKLRGGLKRLIIPEYVPDSGLAKTRVFCKKKTDPVSFFNKTRVLLGFLGFFGLFAK